MADIVVVDYGMGNLRSVAKALVHVAPERSIVVSAEPAAIRAARRVVLPGQSAMPDCMLALEESGLRDAVVEAARERPFLGICLGLQMLFEMSEEGPTAGLGVLAGRVVKFGHDAMTTAAGHKLKPLAADLAGKQRHVQIPLRPNCPGRPKDILVLGENRIDCAYLTEPLGAIERSFTKC